MRLHRSTRLNLQRLEDRVVPATVSLVNGNLLITDPTISGGATSLTLTAVGTNQFHIVDGALDQGTFAVPKNVTVRGTNVKDTVNVNLDGHSFQGILFIDTGAGADTISVTGSGAGNSVGGIRILPGLGDDQVNLNTTPGSTMTFGSVLVKDVGGNDTLTVGNSSAVTTVVGNTAFVGMDTVNWGQGQPDQYGGNVTISAGTDTTGLFLSEGAIGGSEIVHVTGSVAIVGGAGDDVVFLRGMVIGGDLVANLGGTASVSGNELHFSSSEASVTDVVGNFRYTGGDGKDNVDLSSGVVQGNVAIALGQGNDVVNLSSFSTQTQIGGNVVVTGGNGDVQIAGILASIGGGVSIQLGNGHNMVSFDAGSSVVGNTVLRLGNGGNTVSVTVAGQAFGGNVVIVSGTGADVISVAGSGAGPNTIAGALRVLPGLGDDQVNLNTAGAALTIGAVQVRDDGGNDTLTVGNSSAVTTVVGNTAFVGMDTVNWGQGQPDQYGGNVTISAGTDTTGLLLSEGVIAGSEIVHVTGSVAIVGGAGDDVVFLRGMVIGGDLVANLGGTASVSGNELHFSSSEASVTDVVGNFRYTGGDGKDNVDLSSGVVQGNVAIALGQGNDVVNLSSFSTQTQIGGNVVVTGGNGDVQIAGILASIGGGVSIQLGNGHNMVSFDAGSSVVGNTVLRLGNGGNTVSVTVAGQAFGGNVVIVSGTGADVISVAGSGAGPNTIAGALRVLPGLGDDQVNLNTAGAALTIGAVQVRDDGGNDTLTVGNSSAVTKVVGNTAFVGMDTVNWGQGQPDQYGGNVTISVDAGLTGFIGASMSALDLSEGQVGGSEITHVAGTVVIEGGAGDDVVFLRGLVIGGDVVANLRGAANISGNELHLSSSAASVTEIVGDFRYMGGSGKDDVDLSSGVIHGNVAVSLGDGPDIINLSTFSTQTKIGGNVVVAGGDGDIQITNILAAIAGSVSMHLDNGHNTVSFDAGSSVAGTIRFRSGDGGSSLTLAGAQRYNVDVAFGSGDDTFTLDNALAVLAGRVDGGGHVTVNVFDVITGLIDPTLLLVNFP